MAYGRNSPEPSPFSTPRAAVTSGSARSINPSLDMDFAATNSRAVKAISILLAALYVAMTTVARADEGLPDPDGRPADMSKPVQVYILLGQSNMLGFG